MAKLSPEVKKMLGEIRPSLVATASKDGKPNVSPKGSLPVVDDEHIAFAEIASPRTIANLRQNPQVCVLVLDPATRKGCRIWGKAVIEDSGPLFDTCKAELGARKMNVRHVVRISADEVLPF